MQSIFSGVVETKGGEVVAGLGCCRIDAGVERAFRHP